MRDVVKPIYGVFAASDRAADASITPWFRRFDWMARRDGRPTSLGRLLQAMQESRQRRAQQFIERGFPDLPA